MHAWREAIFEIMTCKECADFLLDYIEGALPPQQANAFEQHLELCPPCVDYLDTYTRCIELGKTCMECKEEMGEVPEHFIQAILNARKK